jgi:hypothetical protein
MPVHTRDGKLVINLTGNWHDSSDPSLLTTTRNYFTRDDFLAIRAGIQKLEGTREGAEALRCMSAGQRLSPAQKDLLKTNLGSFAENRNAVSGVAAWVKDHGMEVPEAVLRQGAHAVFPEQMSAAATALYDRLGAEKAGQALSTMRDITAGKAVSQTARSAATKAFEDAGLLTSKGDLTSVGILMLKQEGTKFLEKAGIVTAEGAKTASKAFAAVARAAGETPLGNLPGGTDMATEKLAVGARAAETSTAIRVAGESAEAASQGGRFLGTIMKKVPGVGQVIAAGAAIMGIAGAARAETLPPEPPEAPQNPEEKKARELLEVQADYQKTRNVCKEVIKGGLSLLPVPGADMAFEKYSDDEQERMQARAGAAASPSRFAGQNLEEGTRSRAGRPLEADGLAQRPGALDRAAPISASYNVQAQGLNNRPAAPAVVMVADAGVPVQKPARNRDAIY